METAGKESILSSSPQSGVQVPEPAGPVDVPDYARIAPTRMSKLAWEYMEGAASDELTARWNVEEFSKLKLCPKFFVDVSKLDTRVNLFGREMAFPFFLAPCAYQKLLHPEGEIAAVRGAGEAGATFIASIMATTCIEDICAAATQPVWFQLYMQPDRALSRELIQRAERAGCSVLMLTVDTPVLGPRYRESRMRFALPAGMERANFKGIAAAQGSQRGFGPTIYSPMQDPTMTWKDLEWVQSVTSLPVVLKGIIDPADADRAARSGVAGVVVSNHGGRNVDTAPAAIEVLPAVIDQVAGRIPVLMDGGIRRGTDILKALAFGAKAVGIGRPYLYGLAVDGAKGVKHVINILRREFEMAMAATGRPTLASLDRSVFWNPPGGR